MGRLTLCELCQKEHKGQPPCIKTGKPCKLVEAGLRAENNASQSINWRKVTFVGDPNDLDELLYDGDFKE